MRLAPNDRPSRAIVSVAFRPEEIDAVYFAARARGMKLSPFISRAASEKAAPVTSFLPVETENTGYSEVLYG